MAEAVATIAPGSPVAKAPSKTPTFDKLKGKQRAFCEQYMIDLNGTQAALRAGYAAGENNGIAAVTAHDNLRNPKIAAAIAELTALRTGVTQAWIIDELAKDARSGLADYGTWDAAGNVTLKPSDELTEDEQRRVSIKRTWGKSPSLEIKTPDRQAALFKLADIFKLTKPPSEDKKDGDTFNIDKAVFVRTPVADRGSWEERMLVAEEDQRIRDLKLIEGGKRE